MFGFDWQKDGRKRFISFLKKVHVKYMMVTHPRYQSYCIMDIFCFVLLHFPPARFYREIMV